MRNFLAGLAAIVLATQLLTGSRAVGEEPRADLGLLATRSEELVVTVAPNKKSVWAYSASSGEWKKQPLEGPINIVAPIVGHRVAVVHTSSAVYAFSAKTGTWATLPVADNTPVQVKVERRWVMVEGPGALHIFSEESGKWASLTIEDLEQE